MFFSRPECYSGAMDIILTGTTGKLGGALWRAWSDIHRVRPLRRDMVDFRHPEALRHYLEGAEFDALVNCAAMADPEECEAYPDEAWQVNTESPGVLAEICEEQDARMIHLSTDYVLAGEEPGLKDEHAPTNPLSHYARTKLEGEHRVLEHCPSAVVGRVSWLFGTTPPGFVEQVLMRAQAGEELEAVVDKWSMPTCAEEVSRMLMALLDRRDLTGVFHLTHAGEPQSWWSCATRTLELACEEGLLSEAREVRRVHMADVERMRAPRPVHTAMRRARLEAELGWPVGLWENAVRERLRHVLEQCGQDPRESH